MKGKVDRNTPARMINWDAPLMLFRLGLKASIFGLFGNYADRREMKLRWLKKQLQTGKNYKKFILLALTFGWIFSAKQVMVLTRVF